VRALYQMHFDWLTQSYRMILPDWTMVMTWLMVIMFQRWDRIPGGYLACNYWVDDSEVAENGQHHRHEVCKREQQRRDSLFLQVAVVHAPRYTHSLDDVCWYVTHGCHKRRHDDPDYHQWWSRLSPVRCIRDASWRSATKPPRRSVV